LWKEQNAAVVNDATSRPFMVALVIAVLEYLYVYE
jgi:hypothetical protein